MTPPDENELVAMTYPYWVKTMETLQTHPSSDTTHKQLAAMVLALIELNKHNPATIEFLNTRGSEALES